MKKLLIAAILTFGITLSSEAVVSTSTTISPAGFVLLTPTNGPGYIYNVILQANTATNTSIQMIDCPTNSLVYIVGAYSNTVSYATNLVTLTTNYYGVTNLLTNLVLVDVTNNLVSASTNSYPVRFSGSTLSNSTATFYGLDMQFANSIYATNTSSGQAVVTIFYVPVGQR